MIRLGLLLTMATPEVALDEPRPLAFLLSTPTGDVGTIGSSEIIRILDELFAENTDLRPVLLDGTLMEECRGRLVCVARQQADRLRREGIDHARLLLILSNVTSEDQPDRMSALLLDADRAIALLEQADRDREGWEDELEAHVASRAVLADVRRRELGTPEAARAFLVELVTETLREPLEEAGHYRPYGRIELRCDVEGAAIAVDGKTVGVCQRDPLLIGRVRPGERAIELSHPKHHPFARTVEVSREQTVELEADLAPLDAGLSSSAGRVVFWSGVVLSAAGVAFLGVAAATQDRGRVDACFDEGDGRCSGGATFTRLGPVMTAPLGYSLLGTGAAFSIGSLFEESPVPWISLISGLVIGGAAYGLSAAFGG